MINSHKWYRSTHDQSLLLSNITSFSNILVNNWTFTDRLESKLIKYRNNNYEIKNVKAQIQNLSIESLAGKIIIIKA